MSDKFDISIKDFQSLKNVHISLSNGINVITGKSNIGKSAIIRAINCAIFNIGDDAMVRGGKRYAGVQIDNGRHKLVFCRDSQGKNEKTAYQFDDGPTQKKVGRSQLPEVAKMFNIRDVRMQNNTKIPLNFWLQNDKPFLMDKTSGQLYEFLSLSSCDKYTKVLKKMIVDMKVQEADINNITTEIDTLKGINIRKQEFVDKNKGFEDLYHKIVIAGQENNKLFNIYSIIQRLNDYSERIDNSKSRLLDVTSKLDVIPLDVLQSEYSKVSLDASSLASREVSISTINTLHSKILLCRDELVSIISDFERCNDILSNIALELLRLEDESKKLSDIYNVLNVCHFKSNVICKSKDELSRLQESIGVNIFKDLDDISLRLVELENLDTELNKVYSLSMNINNLLDKLNAKKIQLDGVLNKVHDNAIELENLKDLAGYCPYCGTVFGNHKHEREV